MSISISPVVAELASFPCLPQFKTPSLSSFSYTFNLSHSFYPSLQLKF